MIIRKAVKQYLGIAETKAARKHVLHLLANEKPLGETSAWEAL